MDALRVSGIFVADGSDVLHCRYFGNLLQLGASTHRDLENKICSQVDESVAIIDDYIVCRQKEGDLIAFIIGDLNCCEVILRNALATLFDAFDGSPLQSFTRDVFEQHLSYFIIAVDELFDDGYVFETSAASLKKKIQVKSDLLPLIDMSIGDVFSKAKTSFLRSLLQ
ncbi:hypothetical protein P9112_009582 [Eukaryota sp. TZLM1-RC]